MISLFIVVTSLVISFLYIYITSDLPSIENLPVLLNHQDGLLQQPTRFYDQTGKHILLTLENPNISERRYLFFPTDQALSDNKQHEIPKTLIAATIAASDPNFNSHPGFSPSGLREGSHPTLAQRLVSDLLLWDQPPSLKKAIAERLLAAQVTAKYGRDSVITWFINSANYGHLAYGADAAAQVYLGKNINQINLAEAALLASISEAPDLNPIDAPSIAIDRQQALIQKMDESGIISEEQADNALVTELDFEDPLSPPHLPASGFLSLTLKQMDQQYNLSRLERGGFNVITSLDYDLQMQSLCASQNLRSRLQDTPMVEETENGNPCHASRLLPTLPPGIIDLTGDIEAEALILDPQTGKVLAFTADHPIQNQSSRLWIYPDLGISAVPSHNTGTVLIPYIYITALARGFSPASLVWDIPQEISNLDIENIDEIYHGPVRMRTALANDYVVPAIQFSSQIGPDSSIVTANQFGIQLDGSSAKPSNNTLMSNAEMTLPDISHAYSPLANEGILVGNSQEVHSVAETSQVLNPVTILRIEDTLGNLLFDADSTSSKLVTNPQLAYLITNMLSDQGERWQTMGHPNNLEIGRPAAAKIGRTKTRDGSWTIGYTPHLLVGIWVGTDQSQGPATYYKESTALWHAVIQYASRNLSPQDWVAPPGISSVDVCNPSGMLPSDDCPDVIKELFLTGSEPHQTDSLYRRLQINRKTGLLATVFTPPDLIQEKVFVMVPPEAREWASQAGLASPPDTYDVITPSSVGSEFVQISSPNIFDHINGEVSIIGTAIATDFESYNLQVGKGLNPQDWFQINQSEKQVHDGVLGVWSTQELSGLYALTLTVIDKNQRVETTITQVTVDNQKPDLKITFPADGQTFLQCEKKTITVQVLAQDNLGLNNIKIYIDNRFEGVVKNPPFVLQWQCKFGRHNITVTGTDHAGNSAEANIEFTVK